MIKELAKSIREYKKQAILTPLSVAVEVVLEVIVPYFMALLIENTKKLFSLLTSWPTSA